MVSGIVGSVHNFGVFVHLDGEPDPGDPLGFVRVPEITRRRFREFEEVIATGDRVSGEVLDVDERRLQVYVSLKALEPDPFVPPAQLRAEVSEGDEMAVEIAEVRLAALRRRLSGEAPTGGG